MLQASWQPYDLNPFFPLGTSRGKITKRRVWFLKLWEDKEPHVFGIGEAAPLPGLSIEEAEQVEEALQRFCATPDLEASAFGDVPSVRFAIEMALIDLAGSGKRLLFKTAFSNCLLRRAQDDRFIGKWRYGSDPHGKESLI